MKTTAFFKNCLPAWILLWGTTLVFAISSWLVVHEWRHLRAVRDRGSAVQQEQLKLHRLEAYAASLKNYEAALRRLGEPREAVHKEEITLEPFGAFVEKLSKIYTDQGLFFLESFELKTCDEKEKQEKSSSPCRPYAEVRGRKVYFQP